MIYCLGESLMDIIFEDNSKIEPKAGGAMLNLAISLARCNLPVNLISELGDDKLGNMVISFIEENKVNTSFITKYQNQNTSVALAFLNEKKIPSYSFYKSYPLKRRLTFPENLNKKDILIFGSLYSLDKSIRPQLKQFIEYAKSKNVLIIYDPNIRHSHHLEDKEIKDALFENIIMADIIKASDEDCKNIFGYSDEFKNIKAIKKVNGNAIIFYTKGENGASLSTQKRIFQQKANTVEINSTVGAGDNFTAGVVYYLLTNISQKTHPSEFNDIEFKNMLNIGINFSSEVCKSFDNYISKEFATSL